MASTQAIGRSRDTEPESVRRRNERVTSAQQAGIWCQQLDWLLNASSAALGLRGGMGEPDSGAPDFTRDRHEGMLKRIGSFERAGSGVTQRERYQHGAIERTRRLGKRWATLPQQHQRVVLVHYMWARVDAKIEARFGMLARVVAWQWVESWDTARRPAYDRRLDKLRDEQAETMAELEPIEEQLRHARARARECGRLAGPPAMLEAGIACAWPPRRPPLVDEAQALLMRSRAEALAAAASPLRTRLLSLRAAEAELAVLVGGGGAADAMTALVNACEAGDPPGLARAAQTVVEAAHAAWYAAGFREKQAERDEAARWAEGMTP